MARAATETQKAGLSGLEFGLAVPGHGRRRGLGQRRRARLGRPGGPRVGRRPPRRRHGGPAAGRRARPGVPREPVQAGPADAPDGDPAEIVLGARFAPRAGDAGRHQGAPRRHPALAPGAPAARDPVGGQHVPEPGRGPVRRGADRAGRPEGPARSVARPSRRSTPTSSSTTGRAARRTSGACVDEVRATIAPDGGHRPRARDRVPRRLGGLALARGRAGECRIVSPDERAYPPIVVLLGGPSAEHDVSIVSGTAIAEALSRAGLDVQPGPHRPRRRVVVAARPTTGAAIDRPRRTTTRERSAARARTPSAPPSTASRRRRRSRSCSSRSTARSARTARSRRCSRRRAWRTPAPACSPRRWAWTRSAQKRIWRGLGLPVVDWLEVRAAAWAASRPAVLGQLEAFAGASPRPAADGQAGAARLVGRA